MHVYVWQLNSVTPHTHADTYMKNDVLSIQEGIVNHVEYTMARSRYKFDDFEAYQATSLSLRDRLIGRCLTHLLGVG